jgi:hypothetical protein
MNLVHAFCLLLGAFLFLILAPAVRIAAKEVVPREFRRSSARNQLVRRGSILLTFSPQ